MKPLEGIRIVDLSHVLAMPYATMVLGDLGAQVIKVERPERGDDSRYFGPYVNGESAYFMSVNRSKMSMTLDLSQDAGKDVLRDLIRTADVLAENYRPGALAKLGFSYEEIKRLNPRIIYSSISGFGHDSVYPGRPGYDIVAQAFGGFMSITGYPDAPPTRAGTSIADIFSGLFTAIGILSALRARDITGEGQQLDMAMVDCIMAVLENAVVRYTATENVPQRMGSRHPAITPFDVFKTRDGHAVIGVGNDRLWQAFCTAAPELAALADDPRFASNELRTDNEAALKPLIEAWTQKLTSAEVDTIVSAIGVPSSPVNSVEDIVKDPNTLHRKMLFEFEHPIAGKMTVANNPLSFSETPCKQHEGAPTLGQHTEKVLTEILGYSAEKVAELRRARVV